MLIDGVLSGGGIKGFALIGAYQAIEQNGYKFKRLAGTSAGSIISAFIIAGYSADEILEMMDEVDLKIFLDERKTFFPFSLTKWISLYWNLGLYKGVKLEEWILAKLKNKGISTFADIPAGSLRIIASDLTNGRLIVLPDDLHQYGINPESFSVARAVRMSCSLPYFFEPVRLATLTGSNIVVDGGVLSNFPIWLFYQSKKPYKKRPVLGIKLSSNERERPKRKIQNAIDMYGALFETMKDAHDSRHISSRHEKDIVFLPVDQIVSTELDINEEKKLALIELGRSRTNEFLKSWTF
ncbi:patatin-like phospholipase family protein [Metabacillus bambusae]|uniref:Patatin-like phospholipase family protein n=1 Tax=Metabacillus bambusae TaxID=2795218 RepID=A0ABS3N281_9BACI|nr:patatin-like phospholipase family protein [Metabacillus bambusae]MBO1512407.1 patatin-like phospholipase family protein [Metabacillus bambusae]